MKIAPQDRQEITRRLQRWQRGEVGAFQAMLPMVYEAPRQIAHSHMRSERAGHTLRTTAVAHEAYLRMTAVESPDRRDRADFFGTAARAMRRGPIDHARQYGAKRRRGCGGPPSR